MRIVILYNSCWYVYLLRRGLIRALLARGYTITVVAPRDEYTERVIGLGVAFQHINLTRCGTNPLRELMLLHKLLGVLRTLKPTVVLSYTAKCNLYAGLCQYFLCFRHIPNIAGLGQLFEKSGALRQLIHRFYRTCLSHAAYIFFQNNEDLEHFLGHHIIEPAQGVRLPGSGVDLDMFCPVVKKETTDRRFLILGRLLPQKGFPLFITAAKRLKKKHGDRASFWVLGSPDFERPDSIALWNEIKQAHADGDIRYIPKTDSPAAIIQEADVIVLPSYYNEGVPRSLLEGLACGKPIITTDWKGCRDTVALNKNGLLCRIRDPKAIEHAMEEYIQMSYPALLGQGQYSRKLAENTFDENRIIDSYLTAISATTGT